jgi:hypothetical protein
MTPPNRIGRYEIIRRLGRSMTEVYLAMDTEANRPVALKLIATNAAGNRPVLEAERRGAAIQRELHRVDERMIEIYDFGDLDGWFYVAMQYVEGHNLADVLASEQAIDPARAAVIALEVLEQLAKLHSFEAAVVHGDIKPGNIHLGRNDTVRLLDFGIAKTLRAGCEETNHEFGSPGYCSPERLARSKVDQQSDLWALGATLYEMVSGMPPYQAEDTQKLENLICSGRPPRALPAVCPAGLRAIVAKALAPEPEGRYRSAAEFQSDLQAYLEHQPTEAEMERRGGWSPNATLEAAREALRRITKTAAQMRERGRRLWVAGAVGWFAAGMALWIGGTVAWQAWQPRVAAATTTPPPSVTLPRLPRPPMAPEPTMAQLYLAGATGVLDAWAAADDIYLSDFDWHKAEIYLERAVALGVVDNRTRGSLALVRGYATLERLGGGEYSPAAAAQLRLHARAAFEEAARRMPADARPHLALARVYVYSLPDVDHAMNEFAEAVRLGAKLGAREIEEEGDAWRIRTLREGKIALARRDAMKAKMFYAAIRGYDRADAHMRDLDLALRARGRR